MRKDDDIRAYEVLIRTRTARGQRLELELRDLVQAYEQQLKLEQEAHRQHTLAGLKLGAHVQHVHALLGSREVTQIDAILRERAQVNFLLDAEKLAQTHCELAAQEAAACLQRCDDMRHRIVINEERVSALRMQKQEALVHQSQAAEEVEEDEREEAHAAGQIRRQIEASM